MRGHISSGICDGDSKGFVSGIVKSGKSGLWHCVIPNSPFFCYLMLKMLPSLVSVAEKGKSEFCHTLVRVTLSVQVLIAITH